MSNERTIKLMVNIHSEGKTWPAEIEITVPANNAGEMHDKLKIGLQWLVAAGITPRTGGPPPPTQPRVASPPMLQQRAIEHAVGGSGPVCPTHRVEMKISQHQKTAGVTTYYCTQKSESGGYCKTRGFIDEPGNVTFK